MILSVSKCWGDRLTLDFLSESLSQSLSLLSPVSCHLILLLLVLAFGHSTGNSEVLIEIVLNGKHLVDDQSVFQSFPGMCVLWKANNMLRVKGKPLSTVVLFILSFCVCVLTKSRAHKLHIKLEFFLISWPGERTREDLALLRACSIPEQHPRPLRASSKHTLHTQNHLISVICGRLQGVEHYKMRPALQCWLSCPQTVSPLFVQTEAQTQASELIVLMPS